MRSKYHVHRDYIRQCIAAGLSFGHISRVLGVDRKRLQNYAVKSGLKVPKPRPTIKQHRDLVETLHKQGVSSTDIAAKVGMTRSAVYAYIRSVGLSKHPKRGEPLSRYHAEIERMVDVGLGPKYISIKLCLNYESTRSYLSKNGLSRPRVPRVAA